MHIAQAINYLEAYNFEIGLLINFGAKSLQFKRVINSKFIKEKSKNHSQSRNQLINVQTKKKKNTTLLFNFIYDII